MNGLMLAIFNKFAFPPNFRCGHNVALHSLTRTVKLVRKKPGDIALNGLAWPDGVDFIYNVVYGQVA